LTSEIPGQSGHALPDLQPPLCANKRHSELQRPSDLLLQGRCAGPICGVRTGLAMPKKITTP
jgi:hypothetical protein